MEVLNRLNWNLQKLVLEFHDPYIFDELREKYIRYVLRSIKMNCNFSYINKKISVSTPNQLSIVLSNFYDYRNTLSRCGFMGIIHFQKFDIFIDVKYSEFILYLIKPICIEIQASIHFSRGLYEIKYLISSEEIEPFINILRPYIVQYDVFTWNRIGEVVVLYLENDMEINIYIERTNLEFEIFY